MTRIFLSYAQPDRAFAATLHHALTARGAEVIDPASDIGFGEDMQRWVLDRLRSSDLVIFVVPRYEGQGKSALVELGAAKAFGKRIAAVLPDGMRAANTDFASALGDIYALNASGRSVDALADRVLSDLQAA